MTGFAFAGEPLDLPDKSALFVFAGVERVLDELGSAFHWLSTEERARIRRLYMGADRRAHLAAHLLKRHLLSRVFGRSPESFVFRRDATGRPRLTGAGQADVSLSHVRPWVGIGLAHEGPVGIDVAHAANAGFWEGMERHLLSGEEREEVASLSHHQRHHYHLEHWGRREALAKATGQGIANSSSLAAHGLATASRPLDDNTWGAWCCLPSLRPRIVISPA